MPKKLHELKLAIDFCDDVYNGVKKTFKIRSNDREFQKGDEIRFFPVDHMGGLNLDHPINNCIFVVRYVLNGWGLKNGFVCLAISMDRRLDGGADG